MVGQSALRRIHLGGNGEFANLPALGRHGLVEGMLYLRTDNVLAEGRNEVLDAAGNADSVGRGAHKFHGVADAIAPKPSVGVHDERIVYPNLHLGQAQAGRILVEEAVGRHKLVVNSVVEQQQQVEAVGLVLVGNKAL